MRRGRFWIAGLIALASAMGSYVAFAKGRGLVDRILHPPEPETRRTFVPPPPPAPKPYVIPEETPASSPVAPISPIEMPGMKLPPPRKPQ